MTYHNKCAICEKKVYYDEGSIVMKKKEICKDCRNEIIGFGRFEDGEVRKI